MYALLGFSVGLLIYQAAATVYVAWLFVTTPSCGPFC